MRYQFLSELYTKMCIRAVFWPFTCNKVENKVTPPCHFPNPDLRHACDSRYLIFSTFCPILPHSRFHHLFVEASDSEASFHHYDSLNLPVHCILFIYSSSTSSLPPRTR